MNKEVMFSSKTDLWETPQDFFEKLDQEFGFELDVCALPENAKCSRYFSPMDDGLEQDWTGVCWCNPPYGREIEKWVKKAYISAMMPRANACFFRRPDRARPEGDCRAESEGGAVSGAYSVVGDSDDTEGGLMMERLTFEGNFCEIARCKEVKCPYDTNCIQKQVWERLKAYEDTGLTPEEVKRSKLEIEAGCVKAIARTYGIDINRLRKFAEADRDGRVIVLPCEVGHAAYWVHNGIITDCHINRIQVNRKGVFLCLKNKKSHGAFRVDTCLGKTVFLTREEAEKALAERKGMNE